MYKNKYFKGLLSLGLISFVLLVIFNIVYKVYCDGEMRSQEITFVVQTIKDIFQILFFCTVGIITILSYQQAKKTLFTPIKTEVFKMQMKSFEEILAFFQNKTDYDFFVQFNFDYIVSKNSYLLMKEYIFNFFEKDLRTNKEVLKEIDELFYSAIASKKWAEKNLFETDYLIKFKPLERENIDNNERVLEEWKNNEYGPIYFSKKYFDEKEQLNRIIASPLLPAELINKLKTFENTMHENLFLVGDILNDLAQEFLEKFPNLESIENFDEQGIGRMYHDEYWVEVEPLVKEILQDIREYLKIDNLIE